MAILFLIVYLNISLFAFVFFTTKERKDSPFCAFLSCQRSRYILDKKWQIMFYIKYVFSCSTAGGMRQYTRDFEPVSEDAFDDSWESELTSVNKVNPMFI